MKGVLQRQKNRERERERERERQDYIYRKPSRQSKRFSAETEEQHKVRLIRISANQRERQKRDSIWMPRQTGQITGIDLRDMNGNTG